MGYINSIKTSMLVFPALAFLITLPYMIVNYRKYGSVNVIRTLIVYSFVLYLLTIYLLVILPLPEPGKIHTTYTAMLNLTPFSFVMDMIKSSPFTLTQPATWLRALKHPTFYVPAFNIVMFIPFGIYLRYYFQCSFKKTVLFTALLSLFFEITQLSGLYFIYPGPYRLGDIDDIIQNTAGGCIGYALGWFVMRLFPSREEIDRKSLQAGTRVSTIRITLSLVIDALIVAFFYALLKTPLPLWIFSALYFGMVPLWRGKTIGSSFLRFYMVFEQPRYIRTVLRGILLTGYFSIPSLLQLLADGLEQSVDNLLSLCLFGSTVVLLILFLFTTMIIVLLNRRFFFDRISGTRYQSTVKNRRVDSQD